MASEFEGFALVNGTEYTHESLQLFVFGLRIFGVTSISYSEDQIKQNNKGAQAQPTSRGYGPVSYDANLTLEMVEVERLRDLAPDGKLRRLQRGSIILAFRNDVRIITHRLVKAEFANDGVETQSENGSNARQFGLTIADIRYR